MERKRHAKGSPLGGKFAPDTSGKQPPSTGVQPASNSDERSCQRCKALFSSPERPWAYLCPDCALPETADLHVLFRQRLAPIDPDPDAAVVAEPVFPGNMDDVADVNIAAFKGLGKFDYLLVEGTHYEVVQDPSSGISFRRLNEEGRKEFGKLITRLGPPHDWPEPIKDFIKENDIPSSAVPAIRSSMEFHMVSLLAAHPEYAFERDDLTEFRRAYTGWYKRRENVTPRPRDRALNNKGDAIQQVNKTGQWGLQHQTVYYGSLRQPYYMLRPPFTFLSSARKLRKATPLDISERDAWVNRAKAYHYETFINVPADQWEQGHADPDDDSPAVWQPRGYQRSRRDRFKFDEHGLVLAPTARELMERPHRYYSENEVTQLAGFFKTFLKPASGGPNAGRDTQKPLTEEELAVIQAIRNVSRGMPDPPSPPA